MLQYRQQDLARSYDLAHKPSAFLGVEQFTYMVFCVIPELSELASPRFPSGGSSCSAISLLDHDTSGGAHAAFVVVLTALEGQRQAGRFVVDRHVEIPGPDVAGLRRELHEQGLGLSG